ncbi:site-2 protease family protein [Xylanivirga thermophila]|uniref:site-2 protease family protein n=1 Tax=Xylanivirga thermophila TaxID=2496273 RepID=UPI00101E0089|nr:site-2 protease family protein [Xylanivirga thermophila]
MNTNIMDILFSLPAVFLAMSFHEFGHAYVAYRLGDDTPKLQGRLTLAPLAHVDWLGLIMFLIFGFGWAKPVKIDPNNFKNRIKGDILVSFAGPMFNFILAVISFFMGGVLIKFLFPTSYIASNIIERIIRLNIVFGVLNLIPIPTFDGYNIIKAIFFRSNAKAFWKYERYGNIILLICILTGILNYIVGIPAQFLYNSLIHMSWIFF